MATLTKKQSQGEQTKRRLVDAATRLFAERGYARTSVKHVADAAGVSQGSIFWHFESKEGLLFEVVDRAFGGWEHEVLAPLLADRPGPIDLRAVIDAYLQFARHNPEIAGRLFFVLASEALGPRPELRNAYARIYERFRSYGRRWIESAVEAGTCRPDIDAEATSTVIVGALAGIFLQTLMGGDTPGFERTHEELVKILARGIAAEQHATPASQPSGVAGSDSHADHRSSRNSRPS
jgi:TetR/AcrR family acrAB operon transcriptional repressor